MAWTETARRDHARRGRRYSSDLTDREWALIQPFLPEPKPIGRPRTTDLREVSHHRHSRTATINTMSALPPAALF